MSDEVTERDVEALTEREKGLIQIEVAALRAGHRYMRDVFTVIEGIIAARVADAMFHVEAERDEWKAVAHDGAFWQSRAENAERQAADRLAEARREGAAEAWDQGLRTGASRAMRHMSDEPTLPLATEADNPYRQGDA